MNQVDVAALVSEIVNRFPSLKDEQIYLRDMDLITAQIENDLDFFAINDPACRGSKVLVANSYCSFFAVACYRISHLLHTIGVEKNDLNYEICARQISDYAKVVSGVEIHPAATIACPFVIDHGYGTVIGETSVIGRNCYFLQGVILGARRIVGSNNSKRHPTIGNNVQLGANVHIFGNVNIGDYSFIGPGCTILNSIPTHSTVIKHSEYYIIRRAKELCTFNL